MPRHAFLAALVLANLAGCDFIAYDAKSEIDDNIESLMTDYKQEKALPFFSNGGQFEMLDKDPVHQEVLIPLLARMQNEFKLEPIALIDPEAAENLDQVALLEPNFPGNFAFEIVTKLPDDATVLNNLRSAIREADGTYAGGIETEWGKKWLSLTLYGPDELE